MPLAPGDTIETARIRLIGHVQGVGFRPFVYRTALRHGVTGEVLNKVGEVEIVATGKRAVLEQFCDDLVGRAPPLASPSLESFDTIGTHRFDTFSIAASTANAAANIFVPPDYFMCEECRAELADAADRRYRYPFINCTQCGPRYTLIARLPYDRANTSMAAFPLCDACRGEYEDPADRRFHAEPVACPDCGPQVSFAASGSAGARAGDAALAAAVAVLAAGRVLAVKGVGGYHLMCDASNAGAVERLRERKRRPDKPLAVMFPLAGADGLGAVRAAVELSPVEAGLLRGPVRPIVLAAKKKASGLADRLAPGLAELGVFLPYAPLHQLLLGDFGGPLVATSGNISGEPVLTDNEDASARLATIADAFLHHDRPILRPADDPVFRSLAGKPRPLRIGRGTAPCELSLPWRLSQPVLAVGGHMKGTVAIGWEDRAVVSPHIGEMDNPRSLAVFEAVVHDLQSMYGVEAKRIVCDAHPGYATHRWARLQADLPVTPVWHHLAHAAAVAAEHGGIGDWLVFTWDGVGLGPDGTLWGGEALLGRAGHWQRVASMRPFRLPGGERAGREPWRSAAALRWATGLRQGIDQDPDGLLYRAWQQQLNAPQTTAVGRLFDAAGALVCGANRVSFEAQGPMLLESLCRDSGDVIPLELSTDDDGVLRTDWAPLLPLLCDETLTVSFRAETFHASMAMALVEQVRRIAAGNDFARVGLAGGVFQNRVLTGQVTQMLAADGHEVFMGAELPCNDAALAFGQLAEVAALECGSAPDG